MTFQLGDHVHHIDDPSISGWVICILTRHGSDAPPQVTIQLDRGHARMVFSSVKLTLDR